jgi:hypothetical protein
MTWEPNEFPGALSKTRDDILEPLTPRAQSRIIRRPLDFNRHSTQSTTSPNHLSRVSTIGEKFSWIAFRKQAQIGRLSGFGEWD